MEVSAEKELRLMKEELRKQRLMLFPQGMLFLSFYPLSFFVTGLVSFRCIAAVNGAYFCLNALFTLWQEGVPDLACIKHRGGYREYLHFLFCVTAYIAYTLSQDQNNEHLQEMGSLFILPLSMAWESREAGGSSGTLHAYLVLHSVMTTARFSGDFWSTGWQKVFASCSVNVLISVLAEGRTAAQSVKEQVAALCYTIGRLLSSMCDGYCVLNRQGVIVGADSKIVSLLSQGAHASSLDGKQWAHLLTGRPPAAFDGNEGLRSVQFLTGDGRVLTAEVYTVASTMAAASIRAILGRSSLDVEEEVSGFLCAVRELSVSSAEQKAPSSWQEEEPCDASQLLAAGDLADTSTAPTMDLDPFVEAGTECADDDISDGLEAAALASEEADLLSEPPSLRSVPHAGGFFPPIKALGIGVGEYTKVELVYRGGQGTVWKVQGARGVSYAMKEIALPGRLWRRDFTPNLVRADREVRCLKRLRWASNVIVQIIDSWLREDMTLCIVMEWCPFTLKSVLTNRRDRNQGPPPPEDTCRWLAHIVVGIAVIHDEGFMHRDIKPSNLLLTADMYWCKVADMGISRQVSEASLEAEVETGSCISETLSAFSGFTARCGTQGFQSPEVLQGRNYDSAADIYSLGCVLLQLLVSDEPDVLPLTAETATPLLVQSLRVASVAGSALVVRELHDVCLQMLQETPKDRPTALALAQSGMLKSHMETLLRELPQLEKVLGAETLPHEEALGFAEVDARGIVRTWSAGLAEALGVTRELALGRRLLDVFVASEDRKEFSRLVGPVVRRLMPEACGPIMLQGTSSKLRLWAVVRCSEPHPRASPPASRRRPCPNLTFEFQREEPPAAGAQDSMARQVSPAAAPSCLPAASSAGFQVRGQPAQAVSARSGGCPDAGEGLHERHVRAWS